MLCANPNYHPRRLIIIKTISERIGAVRAMVLARSRIDDNIFILDKNTKTTLDNIDNKVSEGDFAAFICQNFVCSEPILDIDILLKEIEK